MYNFYKNLSFYQRISFLILILLSLLTLIFYFVANRPVNLKSRAQASNNIIQQSTSLPDIDPQTLEYYDLQIEAYPKTIVRTEPGPNFISNTVFHLGGKRILNYSQVYGFIQNPAAPYEVNPINFNLQSTIQPRFISLPTNILYNNCIDLHSSLARSREDYIATFCYNITFVNPNTLGNIAYSYLANPYIVYDYKGSKNTTILFLTTAFNKYNNQPPYDGGNNRGIRVNYLSIDSNTASLDSFTNVKYFIQGLTYGLTNEQEYNLCTIDPTLPKKYLKQTTVPKPEGGNNFEITTALSGCSFQYNFQYLKPFYISLYMDGGIPLPQPSPTPTIIKPSPNPSYNPTPTLTLIPTKIPTFIFLSPTIIPTLIPTNTPTPTLILIPTKIPLPTNTPAPLPTNTLLPTNITIPTPTNIFYPTPTLKICPRGQTKPYYQRFLFWCIKINRCGVSNCRPQTYLNIK